MSQLDNTTICTQRINNVAGSQSKTPMLIDSSSCVTFSDDVVWVFLSMEVWEFHPTKGEWYKLVTDLPNGIGYHNNVATLMPNGIDVFVFNGGGNEFYTISRSTLKYTLRGNIGNDIFSRSDNIMWKNTSELYIHRDTRFYLININTWAVSFIANPGVSINNRVTKLASGNYLFVGGYDTNTVHEFVVSTGALILKAPYPLANCGSAGQSLVEYLNGVYVFGGIDINGYSGLRSIYRYNVSANTWTLISSTGLPIPTAGFQFFVQYSNGKVMLTTGIPYPYDSTNTDNIFQYTQT